jgi:BA14K-like protein
MNRLAALLLLLMNGAAIAQTTGTLNPAPAPAEPKGNDRFRRNGFFPIQCEGIIERERGKVVEQNPSSVEVKPAIKQSEGVASESSNPAVETVPVPKRRDATTSDDDCQHYRSYNRMSGTYTDYSGRRRPCR